MEHRVRLLILRHLHNRETWVVFFVLGLIMMNFPFIQIFNMPQRIFGMPLLYIYLILGWMISICVIYLFVKAIDLPDDEKDKGR